MKVSAVCPACGRPAPSKGRSECLYCGATLQPVATGQVKAAGSGAAVDVPDELKKPLPADATPPVRDVPGWARLPVDETPAWREALSTWRVRLTLLAVMIGVLAYALGRFVEKQQEKSTKPVPVQPRR